MLTVPLATGINLSAGSADRSSVHAAVAAALAANPAPADAPGLDRVVVLTNAADTPVLPDLGAARVAQSVRGASSLASQPASNDLTFTYDSPDDPWPATELTTLRQMVADAYPVVRSIEGPPLFAHPVNVAKTESAGGYAGEYNPSTNEITIVGTPTINVVVHEMIHAFRDDDVMWQSVFEEGMTRAGEVETISRLPQYQSQAFDLHHSYSYDVWYDALSDHRLGSPGGNVFGEMALTFLRYELGGYAWGKVEIEIPSFFSRFNAELYDRVLADPSVPYTGSALAAIADDASGGEVEGLPFPTWFSYQGILDANPPRGNVVYQRISQWTVDDFTRDASGNEPVNAGVTVTWKRRNAAHQLLDTGSAVTTSYGWVDASPTANLGTAVARVELSVTAAGVNGGKSITESAIRTNVDQDNLPGVFGAVSRDVGGTVSVVALDAALQPSGTAVTTTLTNGAFRLPSLRTARGLYKATLTYADGLKIVRDFVKDASDYYLRFPPVTSIASPNANAGRDLTVASGARAALDATASSDPQQEPLSYLWTQTAGPTATIDDRKQARTHFAAPKGATTVTFRLTVTNASGAATSDTIAVTVKAPK